MGELNLPGAILFIVVLLQLADESVTQKGFTPWLDSELLPQVRQARDAESVNAGEAEVFNECSSVYLCLGTKYSGFGEVFGELRLGQIYSSSIGWCSHRSSCWDDTCPETFLKSNIKVQERIVSWICDHREEFLQAIPCFTDPFPAEMRPCFQRHDLNGDTSTDIHTIITEMRNCAANTIDNLPLCTSSSKTLFMNLFNVVAEMQASMYGV